MRLCAGEVTYPERQDIRRRGCLLQREGREYEKFVLSGMQGEE